MKMPNPDDFIAAEPTPQQALVDFFVKRKVSIDGHLMPIVGFKMITDAPTKPKPDFSLVGKKYEITGDFQVTFEDPDLYKKYADKIEGKFEKTWQSLYEDTFGIDEAAPGGDKTGYFTRRTVLHPCPRPHTTNINIPPFSQRELHDERSIMSAVFIRLLTIMRQQRAPGYEIGTNEEGQPVTVPLYRTQQGGRCPFGYMIPDAHYQPNLERMCSNNPHVMAAMGLSAFYGNEKVEQFLGQAQYELHDSIRCGSSYGFMDEFEDAAQRLARQHNLYYYAEGQGRGIPEWARV